MSAHRLSDLLQGQRLQLEVDDVAGAVRELGEQVVPPVARRCELNLVALLSDVHLTELVMETVGEFSPPHPNRTLIALAEPEAEADEQSAYLSVQVLPGTTTICCEQITLRTRGAKAVQALPQKMWPFLVASQPILFWSVQGLPESSALLDRLQKTSAHLVFDTALAAELGITLARANELVEDWQAGILVDLNWLRLAPWREAIAQALTHPEVQRQTGTVQKVSMTFGGGELDEVRLGQPALCMSWLAAHLGWQLVESLSYQQNAFHATWEHQGGEIACEISASAEPSAELLSFTLYIQGSAGDKTLSVNKSVAQEASRLTGILQAAAAGGSENNELVQTSLPETALAQLLWQAYAQPGHDTEYEKVLRLATKLV